MLDQKLAAPDRAVALHRPVAMFAFLCALFVAGAATARDVDSPVGRWQTYDDRTHLPRGIVRIFEKDGKLFGRIEHTGDRSICHACPDERKDQPYDGLVIIRNMQQGVADPLAWEGGDVLDPETGKIYRLKMHLDDSGSSLVVHGYIGVSLIGRSQTWGRAPE
jgi:uncharacterized protein (DUF2147 family)